MQESWGFWKAQSDQKFAYKHTTQVKYVKKSNYEFGNPKVKTGTTKLKPYLPKWILILKFQN